MFSPVSKWLQQLLHLVQGEFILISWYKLQIEMQDGHVLMFEDHTQVHWTLNAIN